MISFGDLSKKAGGDLNANSLLGVKMLMILGAYRFTIDNAAYQRLQRTTKYKWQEVNRLGSNPSLQFTGFEAETINLDGTIYPSFKGGLRQITLMRAQASLGKPLFLISGNGFAFGRWCIASISENNSHFLKDGAPQKIEFNLTLKKYGEDKKAGIKGIIQNISSAI